MKNKSNGVFTHTKPGHKLSKVQPKVLNKALQVTTADNEAFYYFHGIVSSFKHCFQFILIKQCF